ncbi:MAG: dihydroxy-acid dehydratase, partial [Deltaproteobacteria bacterium]|nr:dihydroxy-acid dehydratase [Deltaproteobacteria bacterium]
GDILEGAEIYNTEVIASIERPIKEKSGIAVLYGNLCPGGAIIKPNAASPELLHHRGRAYVFENIEDLKAKIDDPTTGITKDHILVLKGCGPVGYPGMPEVGNMPIPKHLVEQGVTDMVRISDARMSGTAFGTVVLHVSPETEAGGPLAVVETGDEIELNVASGKLDLLITDDELQARLKHWQPLAKKYARGYYKLYQDHVMQAQHGADFNFLVGKSSSIVERESH